MNMVPELIHEYHVLEKIGEGSFGEIYVGIHKTTHQRVAIKVEHGHQRSKASPLLHEARLYTKLQWTPHMHWCGTINETDCAMVMDLMGPSLEDLFQHCKCKFSLKTVVMLALEMLSQVELFHSKYFIHRDIKPNNFVMGLDAKADHTFLIDFGLSKRYADPKTGQHIPFKTGKSLTGTARYVSIRAHEGCEQSRRDDLESLGYVIVYFLTGSLPWQGMKGVSKEDKYASIMKKKKETPDSELCKACPKELLAYFRYVRGLSFEAKPDYKYLKSIFTTIAQARNIHCDHVYDWCFQDN